MSKLSRRQFVHLVGYSAIGAVVAACAPKPTEVAKPTEASAAGGEVPSPAPAAAEPSPAPKTAEKVVFWYEFGGKDADALQSQVDKFASEAEVQVEALALSDHARIIAALGSGSPPDLLMTWDCGAVGTWFANGGIVDLQPYVDKGGLDLDSLHPFTVEAGTMLGRLPALSLANYLNTALYWSKGLFSEVGLDPETPPGTWEEVQQFSDRLTVAEDGELRRLGFLVNYGQYASWIVQYSWGGAYYNEDRTEVTPDDPAMISALNYTRSFFEKYGVENVQAFSSAMMAGWDNDPTSPFYTGAGAIELTGEWLPSFVDTIQPENLDYGVTYMPCPQEMPENKGIMVANTDPMVIATAAKNPEGAWQIIEFLYRPEVSAEMLAIVGNASPVKEGNALLASKVTNEKYKWLLEEVWQNARIRPLTILSPVGTLYSDELSRACEQVQTLQMTAEEAMKGVKEKVQPALDAALQKMGA